MNVQGSNIGDFEDIFDMRIDVALTFGESFVKGLGFLLCVAVVAKEVPIQSDCARLAMLEAKIKNGRVFLKHDNFVQIDNGCVRLESCLMFQEMILGVGLFALR